MEAIVTDEQSDGRNNDKSMEYISTIMDQFKLY